MSTSWQHPNEIKANGLVSVKGRPRKIQLLSPPMLLISVNILIVDINFCEKLHKSYNNFKILDFKTVYEDFGTARASTKITRVKKISTTTSTMSTTETTTTTTERGKKPTKKKKVNK